MPPCFTKAFRPEGGTDAFFGDRVRMDRVMNEPGPVIVPEMMVRVRCAYSKCWLHSAFPFPHQKPKAAEPSSGAAAAVETLFGFHRTSTSGFPPRSRHRSFSCPVARFLSESFLMLKSNSPELPAVHNRFLCHKLSAGSRAPRCLTAARTLVACLPGATFRIATLPSQYSAPRHPGARWLPGRHWSSWQRVGQSPPR